MWWKKKEEAPTDPLTEDLLREVENAASKFEDWKFRGSYGDFAYHSNGIAIGKYGSLTLKEGSKLQLTPEQRDRVAAIYNDLVQRTALSRLIKENNEETRSRNS